MSDRLTVGGNGSLLIATDDVLAAAGTAARLHALAGVVADRLTATAGRTALYLPPGDPAAQSVLDRMDDLRTRTQDLAGRLGTISATMQTAMTGYSLADRAAQALLTTAADRIFYSAGFFAPLLVALLLTPAGLSAVALAIGAFAARNSRTGQKGEAVRNLLSDPRFVGLVRVVGGSADDALRGALHMPPGVSELLDDDATGLFGRSAVALGLVGVVGAALGTRPGAGTVTVARTASATVEPPKNVREAFGRIPRGGSQIAIENYELPSGGRRYFVYLEGTVRFDVGSDETNDMGSNLEELADLSDADALEAAMQAMRDDGIGPDDEVVLVGHSQGAMSATRIAQSGEFNVVGLLTAGNPDAGAAVPDDIAAIGVDHDEDLVGATSGPVADLPRGQVLVTRSLYDGGPPPPGDAMLPAHDLDQYLTTGELIDESEAPALVEIRDRIFDGEPAGSGAATQWHAERVG